MNAIPFSTATAIGPTCWELLAALPERDGVHPSNWRRAGRRDQVEGRWRFEKPCRQTVELRISMRQATLYCVEVSC